MAAPKGNQFWKMRSKHGIDKIFADPALLWEACEEYFEWCENNPLQEEKGFAYQGVVTKEPFSKPRITTIAGLCIFLGINRTTWNEWRATRKDLSEVMIRADEVMDTHKLAYAAADLLNPNIVARLLGLRDAVDTKHSGEIALTDMSDDQLDAKLAAFLTKTANKVQESE
jgi:hypothetical protein